MGEWGSCVLAKTAIFAFWRKRVSLHFGEKGYLCILAKWVCLHYGKKWLSLHTVEKYPEPTDTVQYTCIKNTYNRYPILLPYTAKLVHTTLIYSK